MSVKLRGVILRDVEFVKLHWRCSNSVSLPGFLVLGILRSILLPAFFMVGCPNALRKSPNLNSHSPK
jgi:hypothetical protein